jgi:hypothetical protein
VKEIADYPGIHYTAVSKALRALTQIVHELSSFVILLTLILSEVWQHKSSSIFSFSDRLSVKDLKVTFD